MLCEFDKEEQMINLKELIPIGKEHKITRQELMKKARIYDIRTFRVEMRKLSNKYIVINDDGYYLPASKEEYLEFIDKQKVKMNDTAKIIDLAYKEMEANINV